MGVAQILLKFIIYSVAPENNYFFGLLKLSSEDVDDSSHSFFDGKP